MKGTIYVSIHDASPLDNGVIRRDTVQGEIFMVREYLMLYVHVHIKGVF